MTALLVLTNLPDHAAAEALAKTLVEQRLAACVNILAACTSVYRWQGTLETASEVPLLIKTTQDRYAALEAAVRAAHPYQLPELIALPIKQGLPDYLAWITAETRAPGFDFDFNSGFNSDSDSNSKPPPTPTKSGKLPP